MALLDVMVLLFSSVTVPALLNSCSHGTDVPGTTRCIRGRTIPADFHHFMGSTVSGTDSTKWYFFTKLGSESESLS